MDWDNWQGREWCFAQIEEPPCGGFSETIVPLIAFPSGRDPELVGTGFIISAQVGHAICITAAHVMDGARHTLGLRDKPAPAPFFQLKEELDRPFTAACNRGEFSAHIVSGGAAQFARITAAAFIRPLDVAALVLSSDLFTNTTPVLGINSDFFDPGTRVIGFGAQESAITSVQGGRLLKPTRYLRRVPAEFEKCTPAIHGWG